MCACPILHFEQLASLCAKKRRYLSGSEIATSWCSPTLRGALHVPPSFHPTSFAASLGSTPASLARANASTTVAMARARPPASNACKGCITSISTGWPSLALHSSAMSMAIGCRVHVAKWRCASRVCGPCALSATSEGNTP